MLQDDELELNPVVLVHLSYRKGEIVNGCSAVL